MNAPDYLARFREENEVKTHQAGTEQTEQSLYSVYAVPPRGKKSEIFSDAQATACSACAHVTGRGGCGEPVAAGLSDLPGVIRYHPQQGADCAVFVPHKAELLAAQAANDTDLATALENLIQESARFWEWDEDDLRLIHETVPRDPEGILLALTRNPLRPFYGDGTVNELGLQASERRHG